MKHLHCILCGSTDTHYYYEDENRSYFKCHTCKLVMVPPHQHLSPEEEKKRYDLHENRPDDKGYRDFLSRLFSPLHSRLSPGSLGLDLGSGPGPALHLMFEEAGHQMRIYDPFYAADPSVFQHNYDFITATEVIEHMHDPRTDLNKVWGCLKQGGYLGIMTKLVRNREAFKTWHYIRDDTHVAFYSRDTFEWLAGHWNATVEFKGDDVIIFQKSEV